MIEKAGRKIKRLVAEFQDEEDETAAAELRVRRKEAARHKDALLAERDRLLADIEQAEITQEVRQAIKAKVAKVRGMLENATYENKRFLLDTLDVQARLCRREDGRWLYVNVWDCI